MPIYDFRCRRNHLTESIRPMDCSVIGCSVCGNPAHRLGAYRVAVTSPEVDMRGKFRRFQEASAEMDHAATQVEQSTGHAVTTPNYWKQAQAQAQAMTARGEAPAVHKEQLG